MAVGYNPRAITDGLVLALDAGNPKNYNVGISTNWTDKVGGNNGTLVGGTYHNDGPFVGAGYVEFDGSAYLTMNAATNNDLSGDFTIEAWVYPTANGESNNSEIVSRGAAGAFNGWHLGLFAGGTTVFFGINYAGTGATVWTQSTNSIPLNTWSHIAATRSGNTVRIFLNGVLDKENTGFTGTPTVSGTEYLYVGRASYDTTNREFNGYISNLRIIKGTALYTSNFTPPTKQLTAVTNTVLLTCQGNTIADASSSAHTITANGDISLTKEPFGGAGAVEFDGTGDYLTAGSSSDWTFLNDGSTFTAECWFYSNSTSLQTLLSTAATQSAVGFFLSINDTATGDVAAGIYKGTTGVLKAGSSGSSWNTGTWNHVAVVCDPSLLTLYLNGVSVGTANAASFAFNGSNPAYTLAVGRYQLATPGGYVDGYISNVRFVNGTALYTSNFTPPAEPLTAVTNTELLTCQGQSIKDASSSAHAITVNGDAKATIVSSAFEFDGSNDYVDCGTSTDFDFGTGNYTIEAWIYINDGVQQYHGIFGSSGTGSDSFQFQLQDEKIRLSSYTTEILVSDAADVVPFTQWTHVAISRSGTGATDTKLYKNGSLIKSGQDNINWGSYSRQIGRVFSNNAYDLYGKIAQVKVYKGKGLTAAEVLQNYNATKGRYA
jgi:hypothetical protein